MNIIITMYKLLVTCVITVTIIGMAYLALILNALAWGGMESANNPALLNFCAVAYTGWVVWCAFAAICHLNGLWTDK